MKSNTSSCRANGAINLHCHCMTFPVYCGPLFLVCFGVERALLCVAMCVCARAFFSCSILKVLLPVFPSSLYILSLRRPPSFGFADGSISDCRFKCHPFCSRPSLLLSFVPFSRLLLGLGT